MLHCFEARHEQAFIVHNYLCTEYPPNIELREAVKKKNCLHFSASSQWSKICFGYQGIIFNGKKGLKFSQIVLVRLEGGDPPPQSGQPDRFFTVFFFDPFPNDHHQNPTSNLYMLKGWTISTAGKPSIAEIFPLPKSPENGHFAKKKVQKYLIHPKIHKWSIFCVN